MPVLILLGIGAICGIVSLKDRCTPPNPPPPTNSDAWLEQIFRNNEKRMNKTLRKYGGTNTNSNLPPTNSDAWLQQVFRDNEKRMNKLLRK